MRNLTLWQAGALATELGVAFAVGVLLGLFIGHVIDDRLGLQFPVFMLIGAGLGLASAMYSAWQLVRISLRPRKE
jgi:F0F1-type ATP synthase assembly protein I